MRVVVCEQGTEEWLKARAGRVTGSMIECVGAMTKSGGEAATRRNYRASLICEILTGQPTPQGFVSAEMRWGTEHEPEARAAVEAELGITVDPVGFAIHPTSDRCGASPDGVIGIEDAKIAILSGLTPEERVKLQEIWARGEQWPNAEGLLEIKCPLTATHLGYILAGGAPADYMDQMQWEMRCTGAKFCWFASYDPRLPDYLQLFLVKVPRNEAHIAKLEREVDAFLADLDKMLAALPKPPVAD